MTDKLNIASANAINSAVKAHLAWKTRIQAVINGSATEQTPVETIAQDKQCDLGRWIHGEGGQYFGDSPLFLQLKETHARFHDCASKTMSMAYAGKKQEAQQSITSGMLASISRETVNLLTKMYQEAKQRL